MAYLSPWRESLGRAGAALSGIVHRIPSDCPLCECASRGGSLCQDCQQWVSASMGMSSPRCDRCCLALNSLGPCPDCTVATPAFTRVIAAFDYLEPGDLLIHHLKVGRRFGLAPVLAQLLADAVRQAQNPLEHNTILVPVPASQASVLRRGFNPAAEVARSLSSQLGLRCEPGLLRRAQEGSKQAQLSRMQRALSTQALYACTTVVHGAHIAVVDDVMTTGSTLHSIARQFRASGAASVCGLVLARTPMNDRNDLNS